MGRELKAIPTEYKGVVYRSKCEAMFARYLELDIACRVREGELYCGSFVYEPKAYAIDGWTPDFLCCEVSAEYAHPHLHTLLIEYKPGRPTKTYMDTFLRRSVKLHNKFIHESCFNLWLYWGSVYTSAPDCACVDDLCLVDGAIDAELCICDFDWIHGYRDQIKQTRFDLEASAYGT